MTRRRRTILATASIFTVFVGAAAIWTVYLSPATVRYQLFGDEAALSDVLRKQIAPGASLAEVRELLGPGRPFQFGHHAPQALVGLGTDGYDPEDSVIEYPMIHANGGTGGICLQFRDDKLINHDPSKIPSETEPVRILNSL